MADHHPGFNSRSRVGSDKGLSPDALKALSFNSRSRVGSDAPQKYRPQPAQVSIRAPAWGATQYAFTAGARHDVSIRAPAWGATCVGVVFFVIVAGFNSRSRVGSDTATIIATAGTMVSIRAPAWGATSELETGSRAAQGFNSRSRVGSDKIETVTLPWTEVSIRAPAWGATCGHSVLHTILDVSIRAPAWGATDGGVQVLPLLEVSIRAPAWGATSQSPTIQLPQTGFNSRSRVGSDRNNDLHRRRR